MEINKEDLKQKGIFKPKELGFKGKFATYVKANNIFISILGKSRKTSKPFEVTFKHVLSIYSRGKDVTRNIS